MPDDLILKAVQSMTSAEDPYVVWSVYADALEQLGYDKLVYGGSPFSEGRDRFNIREALILHRGPQGYLDAYIGEELYMYSPAFDWAARNDGFASWLEAAKDYRGPARPEHMRILQLNQEYGITSGYVGSLSSVVKGTIGVIGISPAGGLSQDYTDALWEKTGKDVQTLSNLLQLRICSLPFLGLRRPLTTRQRDALHWFAQGKTMQDIAVIMDLSPATIEKHLRMARDSLDALTTAHAVQKATSLNLLTA